MIVKLAVTTIVTTTKAMLTATANNKRNKHNINCISNSTMSDTRAIATKPAVSTTMIIATSTI